ncbi:MAG: ABC transporter substrate-binding protein [Propioniciclava sp.]
MTTGPARRTAGAVLALLVLTAMGCAAPVGETTTQTPPVVATGPETRVVVDISGREVTIPADVTKVAGMVAVSIDPTIMLGATDQMVARSIDTDYWSELVDPAYGTIPRVEGRDANIEQLIESGTQVAFMFEGYPDINDKLEEAGIAVVHTIRARSDDGISTPEDFIEEKKREIMLHGEVFGGEALERAKRWSAYADEAVEEIYSRTKDLSAEERPRVYYVRGPEALRIHGGESHTRYLVELAGGELVSQEDAEQLYNTTMEQVVAWDPEYIIMGRVDNVELVTEDPAWESIQAVKDGNVYVNLKAIGPADYSTMSLVMMQQIATILHPDLFSDIDMVEKVKEYFATFYDYELTDEEAVEVLTFARPD